MKPNPEHIKQLAALVNRTSFPALLSMQMRRLEPGAAEFSIDIEEKHLQVMGMVHGGVFATLIDTAAFWAVYYAIEDERRWLTSVDLKLNYLAPANEGTLIARGRQIKAGATLCYADATVSDAAGKLLAHGTSTLMIMPVTGPAARAKFPPKFLPK